MILLLIIGCFSIAASSNYDWSYVGETGPDRWHEGYSLCGQGREQSPINIELGDVKYDKGLDRLPLAFYGYDIKSPHESWRIKNTGRSVKVDLSEQAAISGGPLPTLYVAAGFHMHWGSDDSQGSEHTINNQSSPLEIHIVHQNVHTASDGETFGDGKLAVVGIQVELTNNDNEELAPFFDALDEVKHGGDSSDMEPFLLRSLIPDIKTPTYYTYSGSLTTPGCDEGVRWIVLNKLIYISEGQMQKLRTLRVGQSDTTTGKEPLVNNFRPVQPINGRLISTNRPL